MPFRPTSIVVHPLIQEKFDGLTRLALRRRQPALAVAKAIVVSVGRIKADGQWGEVIPTESIPEHYRSTYGVTNLYCIDLPAFHRLVYTIRGRDVIVLDLLDHREYDRLFRA